MRRSTFQYCVRAVIVLQCPSSIKQSVLVSLAAPSRTFISVGETVLLIRAFRIPTTEYALKRHSTHQSSLQVQPVQSKVHRSNAASDVRRAAVLVTAVKWKAMSPLAPPRRSAGTSYRSGTATVLYDVQVCKSFNVASNRPPIDFSSAGVAVQLPKYFVAVWNGSTCGCSIRHERTVNVA